MKNLKFNEKVDFNGKDKNKGRRALGIIKIAWDN